MDKTPEVTYKEPDIGIDDAGNTEVIGTKTDQLDMARMGKQQELTVCHPF